TSALFPAPSFQIPTDRRTATWRRSSRGRLLQGAKINIHPRIDDILRHAIKQFGRRDRLDNAAFILRAVVTKGRRTIKLASQRNSTDRNCSSDYAKDKSTPSDRRAEFIVPSADCSLD